MKRNRDGSPRRENGRLPRLSRKQQREYHGAAWEDLPPVVAAKIVKLFKATGCMDLYDSPCEFIDVATQRLEEMHKQVDACRKFVSKIKAQICAGE